jgi:hypothetical protein
MSTLFPLGRTAITAAALDALTARALAAIISTILARHELGDWGDLDDADREANDLALKVGGRLISAYDVRDDLRVWVITERDRSVTTIRMPEDD